MSNYQLMLEITEDLEEIDELLIDTINQDFTRVSKADCEKAFKDLYKSIQKVRKKCDSAMELSF